MARAYLNDDPSKPGNPFCPCSIPFRGRCIRSAPCSGRTVVGASRQMGQKKGSEHIEGLLQTRGVAVESPALAWRVLEACRKGAVGFADHLIREVAFESGASEVITFDKAFGAFPAFAA